MRFARAAVRTFAPLWILALALGISAAAAHAATIVRDVEFSAAGLRVSEKAGELHVELRGAYHRAHPGEPDLPFTTTSFEIPAGQRVVSWRVTPADLIDLDARGRVAPAPALVRTDGKVIDARASAAYNATSWVPAQNYGTLQQGALQGHDIATMRFQPVQYLPSEGRVRFTRRFRVEITTAATTSGGPLARVRRTEATEAAATRALRALNIAYSPRPNARAGRAGAFPQSGGQYPAPFNREYAYVIVTADSLVSSFQPLADWKTRQGIPAHIEPISNIVARYPQGVDLAEKVRLYARDCYLYSGTVWLMLGGDASVIPPRFCHSDLLGGENIPADMYFGNLDGTWNYNGNAVFGEAGEEGYSVGDTVDFYPELYVGRAPCGTRAQVTNFIGKTLAYDQAPPSGSFLNNNLLFAEVLFPANYDSSSGIIFDGTLLAEDVQDSMPGYNHFAKLYENNNQTQFPGSIYENASRVRDSLNVGYNLAVHVGHGFRNTMSTGADVLLNADMRNLHNGPRNSYLISVDCTSGAIDFDCIGAAVVNNTGNGAFAFWGSTREAFPVVTRNYLQAYFHYINADSTSEIGEALSLAKVQFAEYTDGDYPDRWTQYAFILFGDPGLRLRTRPGLPLSVASAASFTSGDAGYPLTVTCAGAPVESAYVCVYKPGDDLRAGYTNAAGQVTLPFQPDSTGSFQVTASLRNALPYMGTANVVARSAAYLYDYSSTKSILDGVSGPQNGNSDSGLDAGETVQIGVTVGNNGGASGTAVTGTLSTSTPGVTVTGSNVSYGTLASHGTAAGFSQYTVSLSRSLLDGQKIPFNLHLTDTQGDTRDDYFTLPVRAPLAEHYAHTWVDSVSGPTHFTLLKITVRNLGGGAFRGLSGKVRPVSSGYIPLDSVSDYGNLASGASWIGTKEYRFQGQATQLSRFYLYLTDAYGHVDSLDFDLKPPGAVANLNATGSQSSIALTWTASPDSTTVKGYYIYRSLNSGGPFARANSRVTTFTTYYSDAGLAALTPYFYYVTAVDSGGNESAASATASVSTNPPYHLGFPIGTTHEMPGSPVLVNFDHSPDGSLEVVQASDGIYIWHPDGTEMRDGDGQPLTSGVWVMRGTYYPNSVSVANLFQDGKFYVIAVTNDSSKVIVWNENGNVVPGWPKQMSGSSIDFGSVAVGDIDGDGKPEIVVGYVNKIYAWHRDGTEVRDGDNNPATNGVFATVGGSYIYGSPALADLNGDGKKEIIIGASDAKLYAFKYDGTQQKGFPYTTSGAITGSPAVADLDLDGHMEVIFPSTNNNLYVLSDTATVKPGWPVAMNLGTTSRSPSPAIADMDGDGYPDVVESSTNGYVKALSRTGAVLPGWSNVRYAAAYAAQAGTSESSPIVGDIDGDGQLEVLQGAEDATLYGFNHDGTTLAGFPIRVGGEIRGTPAAWDLTNTGKINIVLPCWDKNVYIWDYPGTFHANLFPWPMFRHDDQHTGQYVGQNVITAVGEVALDAEAGAEGIRVRWSAPEGIAGRVSWNVYRREGGSGSGVLPAGELRQVPSDFVQVNAEGLSAAATDYLDRDVRGGGTYAYIVEMRVDGERSRLVGPLVRVMPEQFLPIRWALGQNVPNPFRGRTVLRYAVPAGVKGSGLAPKAVRITVHDVTGREVRVLAEGLKAPGSYSAAWDGRDGSGRELGSGVYFYRLVAAGETLTRKIILIR